MYSVIVKFRLSTLNQIAYHVDTKKYSGLELTPVHTATKVAQKPIQTHQHRRNAASLRNRNRTKITLVFMCEHKPYLVCFSCWRKSYPGAIRYSEVKTSSIFNLMLCANGRTIVGQQLPTLLDVTCCVCLRTLSSFV